MGEPLHADMATERQIAANRRNARNSTGPKSSAGKKRSRRNSYRYGLTATTIVLDAKRTRLIERLAEKIAGDSTDLVLLEHARSAAHAEFDLAYIRQIKTTLINRILIFGTLDVQRQTSRQSEYSHKVIAQNPAKLAEQRLVGRQFLASPAGHRTEIYK